MLKLKTPEIRPVMSEGQLWKGGDGYRLTLSGPRNCVYTYPAELVNGEVNLTSCCFTGYYPLGDLAPAHLTYVGIVSWESNA